MHEKPYYKSRLRTKGQITVPAEIRAALGAEEGDDLLFYADEKGQVIVSRTQIIPPEQAWFWSERWQQMERQAQAELESGEVEEFSSVDEALAFLSRADAPDAEG